MAFPTTNLVSRYIAGVGVTNTSGRVSQWDDQQSSHDLTQSSSGVRPVEITSDSSDGIAFGSALTGGGGTVNNLTIPSGLTRSAQSSTLAFVFEAMTSGVGRAPSGNTYMAILGSSDFNMGVFAWFDGSTRLGEIVVYHGTNTEYRLPMWFPAHRSILVIRASASDCKVSLNDVEVSKGSALISGTATGGALGDTPGAGGSFKGAIYEAAFWSSSLSDTDRDNLIAQWKSDWSIGTKLRNIIILGDSIDYGIGVTDGTIDSWIRQCSNARRLQDKIYNFGIDGARIDQVQTWWSAAWDTVVDPSLQNIVIVGAGINDVTQGASNATITTRMQSLLSAIRAELNTGDLIIARTLVGNATNNSIRVEENTRRLDGTTYTELDDVADMTGDTDLEDTTSSAFASDDVHPSTAGNTLMAGYINPYLAPPAIPPRGIPFGTRSTAFNGGRCLQGIIR